MLLNEITNEKEYDFDTAFEIVFDWCCEILERANWYEQYGIDASDSKICSTNEEKQSVRPDKIKKRNMVIFAIVVLLIMSIASVKLFF